MNYPIVLLCLLLGMALGGVVAYGAVPERPHLFFSAGELEALRERVKSPPFAFRWGQLKGRADVLLEEAPVDFARENLGNMGTLAFAYAITEDERYARRALEEAKAVIQRDVWVSPRHVSFTKGGDLVTSELSLGMSLVYDWCHAALSEDERALLRNTLLGQSLRLYAISVAEQTRDWWFEHEINNWRGVSHGGMGVAAMALYHESEEARRLARINRQQILRVFQQVVLQDGGGHEGVGYHHYGIVYATYALMAGQRIFDDDATERTLDLMVDKMASYWDIYMQGPDLLYANIGRMGGDWGEGLWALDPEDGGGPHAELCALFEAATPGGDRLLLWGADNGSSRFYWPGASPFWFLWRRPEAPSLRGEPKPELQEAVLFRGAGHAILQSKDLWLAFSGGRTHNRRDLGAFVLVAGKERFVHIPESNKVTDTSEQSAVLVNGQGQKRDARGKYRRFGSGKGFHYLAVDLSGAYQDLSLERYVRHLVMVDGKFVVILDDLAARDPAVFEARVQTEKDAIEGGRRGGRIGGETADLHVLAAGDLPVELTMGASVLRYLAVRSEKQVEEASLVTALYPTEPGAEAPSASFENGVVSVGKHELRFERGRDGWRLTSVNGETARDVPTGAERSVKRIGF